MRFIMVDIICESAPFAAAWFAVLHAPQLVSLSHRTGCNPFTPDWLRAVRDAPRTGCEAHPTGCEHTEQGVSTLNRL